MRKIDQAKPSNKKVLKTINFEKIVLEEIEKKAKKCNINVSALVNEICKQVVMDNVMFFRELSKFHYMKFQEYQYLKKVAEEKK